MPASSISIGRESAEIEFHGKGEIKSERSSKDYLRPRVCRFEIIRIKGKRERRKENLSLEDGTNE